MTPISGRTSTAAQKKAQAKQENYNQLGCLLIAAILAAIYFVLLSFGVDVLAPFRR
jgi:hypothetical protein